MNYMHCWLDQGLRLCFQVGQLVDLTPIPRMRTIIQHTRAWFARQNVELNMKINAFPTARQSVSENFEYHVKLYLDRTQERPYGIDIDIKKDKLTQRFLLKVVCGVVILNLMQACL